MSETIVNTIITNAKSLLSTYLTGYTQLDYEYDIESNHFKNKNKRYGFIPKNASRSEGTTRSSTFEHVFQLILTTDFNNKSDDTQQRAAVAELFEKTHDMYKIFANNALGASLVEVVSISEPEVLDDKTVIVLRSDINIKYRYNL